MISSNIQKHWRQILFTFQPYWLFFLLIDLCLVIRQVDSAFIGCLPTFHRHYSPTHRKLVASLGSNTNSHSEYELTLSSSASTALKPFSSSLADDPEVRAGSEGYSLLRQPASRTNWDPDTHPEYNIPIDLNDEGSSRTSSVHAVDNLWWSNRFDEKQKKASNPSVTTASNNKVIEDKKELDLFQRSLDTLDFPRVLASLRRECTTAPARRIVDGAANMEGLQNNNTASYLKRRAIKSKKQAFQPLLASTVRDAQERYRAVTEMQWILQGSAPTDEGDGKLLQLDNIYFRNNNGYKETIAGRLPPYSGSDFDLDLIFQAVDKGRVLEAEEILLISGMMDIMNDVLSWSNALHRVESVSFAQLLKLSSCIEVNSTLHDLLHNSFDNDERLSGSTFPVLGRLRARVRALRADIMGTLDALLVMPSMKSKLALESGGSLYSEVSGGRLVIPVEAKYASSIGIVHDTSRSGKTVYVEPTQIIGPTNELRQVEGELRSEEAKVWRLLTTEIMNNRRLLEASVNAIGQLDLVVAKIQIGRRLTGVVPVVKDEGVIQLKNAKHPILLLRELQNVVGSDIELGSDGNQGLVLTGPNSGGKTIILKLLGLVALMARGGIPIPADTSVDSVYQVEDDISTKSGDSVYRPRVDFFNPVLADIGDLQSVGGDLSTFSGHMLVCREILANSGKNALVLMDEVGSGTDPNQGVAIAQALLEALVETGARVAVTTHFMQLKQLAAGDSRFSVGGMQFVNGRPTYKLLPGTVGESFALAVAERLEIPQKVINRALELLDSDTRQMGDLIRELEDQKALVDQQALDLEEKKRELARMEFKMKEEQIRLEKKQLTARREEAKKFAQKLEEKENILEDILEKLKSDPSRRIVAKSWEDIKFTKRDALNEAENVPSVLVRKQKVAQEMNEVIADLVPIAEMREKPELKAGDTVIVCKKGALFGRQATVVQITGSRIDVKVNNLNVALKLSQVAMPVKGKSNNFGDYEANARSSPSRRNGISKSVERALANEKSGSGAQSLGNGKSSPATTIDRSSHTGISLRTDLNTVDVRGCNLVDAQEKVKTKFSTCLMNGRLEVYILHGHGTGGVLKSKIRRWLGTKRQLVKRFAPADPSDGGDAFTRVELR